MRKRQLVIMVKQPRPGRVKTRLAADIGSIGAAWWFRHQCRHLLRHIESPCWQTMLAVAPDTEGLTSRVWPENLPRIPQGSGDLSDRMARLFRTLPPGPMLIIGADIPGVTRRHIASAFKALGDHDAVLGPAPDGGYWLIGLKRSRPMPPNLFQGVRWSSKHAMADTVATLHGRVAMIETLQDVDTASDLEKVSP